MRPPFLRRTARHVQDKHKANDDDDGIRCSTEPSQLELSLSGSSVQTAETGSDSVVHQSRKKRPHLSLSPCADGFLSTFACEEDAFFFDHKAIMSCRGADEGVFCASEESTQQVAYGSIDLRADNNLPQPETKEEGPSLAMGLSLFPYSMWSLGGGSSKTSTIIENPRPTTIRFAAKNLYCSASEPLTLQEKRIYFWSDVENRQLKEERRTALLDFKNNYVKKNQALLWDDETEDSIRGLEDHTADLLGNTNSYYLRQEHTGRVLREYHSQKILNRGKIDYGKLRDASLKSSLLSHYRAIERAHMDHRKSAMINKVSLGLNPTASI